MARFRQPDIADFTARVAASGMVYRKRWGDAPLRCDARGPQAVQADGRQHGVHPITALQAACRRLVRGLSARGPLQDKTTVVCSAKGDPV